MREALPWERQSNHISDPEGIGGINVRVSGGVAKAIEFVPFGGRAHGEAGGVHYQHFVGGRGYDGLSWRSALADGLINLLGVQ